MPRIHTDLKAFEAKRLAYFASEGVVGDGISIEDESGKSTYVLVSGEGSPARLLIHGGLSESTNLAVLAGRLVGRLLIPDRPGYGLSYRIDYRETEDFLEAAADWVRRMIGSVAEPPVDLIGNSMGGLFAAAFASTSPDLVRRLVLVGAPAGIHRELSWFLRAWAHPILGRLIMRASMANPEDLRTRVYPGLVAHPDRVSDEQLAVEFMAGHIAGTEITSHTMLNAVLNLGGVRPRYLIGETLLRLELPTLFLWGERDEGFGAPALGAELAQQMPSAEFRLIPDAGHLPWLDEPDVVGSAINRFLS